jgi:hypothetical protein
MRECLERSQVVYREISHWIFDVDNVSLLTNSLVLVRERPPFVGEVSANFYG